MDEAAPWADEKACDEFEESLGYYEYMRGWCSVCGRPESEHVEEV